LCGRSRRRQGTRNPDAGPRRRRRETLRWKECGQRGTETAGTVRVQVLRGPDAI
jgi:hypothetical protein